MPGPTTFRDLRHIGFAAFAALLVLAQTLEVRAAEPAGLQQAGHGRVVDIVDGDTVVLENDTQIRLVGLQAPKLALGRRNFDDWPLAHDARAALADLVDGRIVEMHFGGRREDRHGRTLAHLVRRSDRLWIQREMLLQGMARVYTFPDNRAVVDDLLAAERVARDRRRGIWSHPYYRIRAPRHLGEAVDSFQIVEGRVVDSARVRGRIYLNFGADWREDFTVTVASRDRRIFEREGDRLGQERFPDLAGQRLRVRGWIKEFNGPMIEVTHPEQIEWLD